MNYLILFSIIVTLSFVALDQDAFGILGCDVPHCYSLVQSSRASEIDGIQYELDSPDLFVDQTACENIAVSTGWLTSLEDGDFNREWVESGVTQGSVMNVGCVTVLSTYYAVNNIVDRVPNYQEYLVPNGRVDPGDNIEVILQRNPLDTTQIQVFLSTPDNVSEFARAQLSMNPNNIYFADYGIEGTISGPDEYSSIPMSKFTSMQIRQSDTWFDLPTSAVEFKPDTSDGYIGEKCSNTSFIAGSVLSVDCDNIAVRNQVPIISTLTFDPDSDDDIIIPLDAIDTDFDYLIYYLVESPTNGFLDHVNLAVPIPNTDGDSSQLIYTPASNPPEDDIIRYSVTDARIGHTVEGLITIIGTTPGPTIPDAVDNFDFTLSGTTITFTWSHPYDGGSPIESYVIEHSDDTVTWNNQDVISETQTSYVLVKSEGYDEYFRIFANNAFGDSAASNIVHVHIDDTTGPNVTIQNPLESEIFPAFDVSVDGNIYESENSGIENILIQVDGITSDDPIFTTILLQDVSVIFDSVLTSLDNGVHTITAFASNGDGYTGSDSVTITIDVPESTTLDSFSEDFEVDMSNWILSTEDDEFWSVRTPLVTVPDSLPGNTVAGTEDCDDVCTMVMIDHVDLTPMAEPTLSFYRYVATGADIPGEGIIVYYSEDDGFTWNILDSFLADDSKDDGIWHLEEYDLSMYSTTQFKVKFDAISTANSEDTELDDISITDAVVAAPGSFISSFDGTDGGGTEFVTPFGVTVDSNDRIIVTDVISPTVQIFDSDGLFLDSFDGTDGGGTEFVTPFGVTVDSNDRIIVGDINLNLVQIFDSDGLFLDSFNGTNGGGTEFVTPFGVTVDSNDRIIVTDLSLRLVQVFDSNGDFEFSITGSLVGATPFVQPYGVAVDSTDRIIVSDNSLQLVQVFDDTGVFLNSIDGTESGETFENPRAVAVDSNDNIIVVDNARVIVQIFDSDGLFLDSFNGTDGGIAFVSPFAITVDSNDRIIVADLYLDLVQIFAGFIAD